MAKNKETVILSNPELGERPFDFHHAQRILKHDAQKKITTWTLHDPKLIFEDGKISTRTGD